MTHDDDTLCKRDLSEYVALHSVAGLGACVAHLHGHAFQFLTNECHVCDYAGTQMAMQLLLGRNNAGFMFTSKEINKGLCSIEQTNFLPSAEKRHKSSLKTYDPNLHARN